MMVFIENSILDDIKDIEEDKNYFIDPLPINLDGVIKNIIFVNCIFSEKCKKERFEKCSFLRCRNVKYLTNCIECGVNEYGAEKKE